MINVNEIFNDMILESGAAGHMNHLFECDDLTFADIRDIMQKIFCGDIKLEEKIDGINLFITYKNGKFCVARNQKTIKDPLDYDKLTAKYYNMPKEVQEAFMNSLKDLSIALSELDPIMLNKYFANGQNFLNCEIVYPPCANVIDYGNKCFIVLHGIKCFNDKFKEIGEDTESAVKLFELLQNNGALQQEMFEITKPNVLRLKNIVSAKKALEYILSKLEKFIDGVGWKCSLGQYVHDRYSRHIVNTALKHGIDVSRNSDFVKTLAQRLSTLSHKRPTKSDLITYAKCDGVNYKSDEYKAFIDALESDVEVRNAEIIKPIEELVILAGILLMKNVTGFMSADPSKTAKKILSQLDNTILQFNEGDMELTPEKVARFKKNLAKIDKYHECMPAEGVVIRYNGKIYKLTGSWGPINQLLGIIKYK